jgi:hypothetical protein
MQFTYTKLDHHLVSLLAEPMQLSIPGLVQSRVPRIRIEGKHKTIMQYTNMGVLRVPANLLSYLRETRHSILEAFLLQGPQI